MRVGGRGRRGILAQGKLFNLVDLLPLEPALLAD
jgi:hypothetical protein